MSCIYCTYTSNGYIKLKTTRNDAPKLNPSTYLWALRIKNATRAEMLFLKSIARLAGEKSGLKLCNNDYFKYNVKYPYQPQRFHEAVAAALPMCRTVAHTCSEFHLPYRLIEP